MRKDEEFVITAVASYCSGSWRTGEDPPDAYIDIGNSAIAVEISMLTQSVTTVDGTRARLSDDQTAICLAGELDTELKLLIPDGTTVGLRLCPPLVKFRKTKKQLAHRITALMRDSVADGTELKLTILDNDIELWVTRHGDPQYKKVSAIIYNRNSSPNILRNAAYALADRIGRKSLKCTPVKKRPLWLALLNDYWLADADTYSLAMTGISIAHPFEKILMVSGDGSVTVLYDSALIGRP
jgi:hypothetical protein